MRRFCLRAPHPLVLTLAILAPLLLAGPAQAHPNASTTPLRPGQQAIVTVLLFADEGPTTGFEIRVPDGIRLDGAGADRLLPQVSTSAATATFTGGIVRPGEFVRVVLRVTPSRAGPISLAVRAQLQGVAAPYDYPPVPVGGSEAPAARSRGVLLVVLVLGVVVVAGILTLLTRRRGSAGTLAP